MLILDPEKECNDITNAHGVSCLEFEPTIPTKFMVGTDRGKSMAIYASSSYLEWLNLLAIFILQLFQSLLLFNRCRIGV